MNQPRKKMENATPYIAIATLAWTVICGIVGGFAYLRFEGRLNSLNQQLSEEELAYRDQQILLVDGKLAAHRTYLPGDPPVDLRRVAMHLQLRNAGRKRIEVGRIELVLSRCHVTAALQPRKANDGRKAESVIEIINAYSSEDWSEFDRAEYDPSRFAGGDILSTQSRAITLETLIRDGETPELVKFEVNIYPPDSPKAPQAWGKATWVGITGCGPLSHIFPDAEFMPGAPMPVYVE